MSKHISILKGRLYMILNYYTDLVKLYKDKGISGELLEDMIKKKEYYADALKRLDKLTNL